jgi:DNA-directed RNA polymerase specialized sigma24 family protein
LQSELGLAQLAINKSAIDEGRGVVGAQTETAGLKTSSPYGHRFSCRRSHSCALEPADLREPSPADAAALLDLVEQLLAGLQGRDRQVCELRLEGYAPPEIAERAGCSEATVFRELERVQQKLHRLLPREDG